MVARAVLWSIAVGLLTGPGGMVLPQPPAGFSWVEIDGMRASFLRPDGWHFTSNKAKLLGSFVISKEKPDLDVGLQTGLTVYSIRNMGKTDREPPSRQVHRYANSMKTQEAIEVFSIEPHQHPPFEGLAVRYRVTRSEASGVMHYRLLLANDQTDILLFITFQSPESAWDEAWETGRTLVTTFVVETGD